MLSPAARIQLPNNGWRPRARQMDAWRYMENGGRHAELIWHRRFGKDELALHWAAIAAHQRPATYWHMLPEAAQARKAIWEAINPHTGKRRIDEAFPLELRATTREQEMLIKFKCGSTWQVVGSDNFNSLVGSPPAGITYSEWALANPAARAYLRPILLENKGWQLFITTPRGKNHAHATYAAALANMRAGKDVFAQVLTANDTGVLTPEQLAEERKAYQDDFGVDAGDAMFRQEYLCDFDAAILGAIYGKEMSLARTSGRICEIPYDPAVPVHTFWDIGRTDDTAIWFMQRVRSEIRLIDYHSIAGADVFDLANAVQSRGYELGDHWLPHDARAKTLAANGKSVVEQLHGFGIKGKIVPNLSRQDGIQAARALLPFCHFDEKKTETGVSCLASYQREWDTKRRIFTTEPLHNWASHGSDAFRMLAVAIRDEAPKAPARKTPDNGKTFANGMTLNDLWARTPTNRKQRI